MKASGEAKLNWKTILDRKNQIVTKHTKGLDFLMRKNKVTVVPGFGRLTGSAKDGVHTVEVTDGSSKSSQIKTKNIVLATGSEARMLSGLVADERILTNIEILSISQIPKSLVVIGAGAVGVEFASIFRSFGSEITLVEYLPRLVPVEDEDVSKELARSFRKRGIETHTGAKVEKVEKTKTGVKVTFTASDGKQVVKEAEKVLVAVGRAPRTEGIGLEKTKIAPEKGFIKTNRMDADRRAGHLCDWRYRCRIAAAGALRLDGRHGGRGKDSRQICAPYNPRASSRLHLY